MTLGRSWIKRFYVDSAGLGKLWVRELDRWPSVEQGASAFVWLPKHLSMALQCSLWVRPWLRAVCAMRQIRQLAYDVKLG